MRDFVHIEDYVGGILMTMNMMEDAGARKLSTGVYTGFMEFARLAAAICAYHPEVVGMSD